jgi:hypothetical protein
MSAFEKLHFALNYQEAEDVETLLDNETIANFLTGCSDWYCPIIWKACPTAKIAQKLLDINITVTVDAGITAITHGDLDWLKKFSHFRLFKSPDWTAKFMIHAIAHNHLSIVKYLVEIILVYLNKAVEK